MSVLSRIVADKRADVALRKARAPLASFRGHLAPSDRSLESVLRGPRTGFILECKRASPSEGVIRADYDPVAIALAYAPVADAISVLCDTPYFGGDLAHLSAVRAAASCPVLCKDFVVDPYQVYEARRYGADAVLLMASVLAPAELASCLAVARELSVDALVEVHDGDELDVALELDAPVVGINNRDLQTLAIDLDTTRRLAPRVPAERVVVGESGLSDHDDVRALRAHCDAFLVGSALMRASDISAATRSLVYGRTKVCGLTRPHDARAAKEAGATHGGVVLWPSSPRAMTVATSRALVAERGLQWVGVFVDATPKAMVDAADALGLAAVQLHGEEGPEVVAAVKAMRPELEVWRAVRVREGEPLPTAAHVGADRLLLDAFIPGTRGGTGHQFDWARAASHPECASLVLSGGIDPSSAARADAVGTWALDASSGLETAPGRKDHHALRAFLEARRTPPNHPRGDHQRDE